MTAHITASASTINANVIGILFMLTAVWNTVLAIVQETGNARMAIASVSLDFPETVVSLTHVLKTVPITGCASTANACVIRSSRESTAQCGGVPTTAREMECVT